MADEVLSMHNSDKPIVIITGSAGKVGSTLKQTLEDEFTVVGFAGCLLIGVWLLFTRITLDSQGNMANADHLIGALVLTVTDTAAAEVMRSIRFLNIFLGMALLITPFVFGSSVIGIGVSIHCGLGLIALSIPRGPIKNHYGKWSKTIL